MKRDTLFNPPQEGNMVGFNAYEDFSPQGFTEENLKILEQTLIQLSNNEKLRNIYDFNVVFLDHIQSPAEHLRLIEGKEPALLQQLYDTYLSFGGTGMVSDMVLLIDKIIGVATWYDYYIRIDEEKALPDSIWIRMMNDHLTSDNHEFLHEINSIPQLPLNMPCFGYSDVFISKDKISNIDLSDNWTPNSGTLFFKFTNTNTETNVSPLLTITEKDGTITDIGINTLSYSLIITQTKESVITELLNFPMSVTMRDAGYNHIVFSFNESDMVIKDLKSGIIIDPIFKSDMDKLVIHYNNFVSVVDLSGYAPAIRDTDLHNLLNQRGN